MLFSSFLPSLSTSGFNRQAHYTNTHSHTFLTFCLFPSLFSSMFFVISFALALHHFIKHLIPPKPASHNSPSPSLGGEAQNTSQFLPTNTTSLSYSSHTYKTLAVLTKKIYTPGRLPNPKSKLPSLKLSTNYFTPSGPIFSSNSAIQHRTHLDT